MVEFKHSSTLRLNLSSKGKLKIKSTKVGFQVSDKLLNKLSYSGLTPVIELNSGEKSFEQKGGQLNSRQIDRVLANIEYFSALDKEKARKMATRLYYKLYGDNHRKEILSYIRKNILEGPVFAVTTNGEILEF